MTSLQSPYQEAKRARRSVALRGNSLPLWAVRLIFQMAACLAALSTAHPALAEDELPSSGSAHGLQTGDVLLRARISGILPYNLTSKIDLIGGEVEVPRMILPDVDISYFLTDRIAVTGQAGALKTDFTIRDSLYGDIDVGSIWALPVAVSLEYHFMPDARFNPYIGAGVVATWYVGAEPASSLVKDFSVTPQVAPMIRAGVDYRISEKWFANFELKQVLPPTQVLENSGVTARTDVNTISAGIGIGYRF